ncbi:hypothetical protein [Gordonia neofelifaecis]|uniref:Polyketide cyclase/dehydrase n=1 Tax=Gordonia neofelifaecis NRRL B-59395 TaxID=644548 RepID=F1YP96_9ACTN|nr:hypothetical protein SCNU_18727 [Gordonia neofelifaecis NRRL B-59395]
MGSRARALPAPPNAVFEDLIDPARQPVRPWLTLLADETPPGVLTVEPGVRVVWTSIWPRRPDARIEFELTPHRGGTTVAWLIRVDGDTPDDSLAGHMRKRINELVFANLRYTYGQ